MIYALIQASVVINVIEWDGDVTTWQPPDGETVVLIPDGSPAWIGWGYVDGEFTPPAP